MTWLYFVFVQSVFVFVGQTLAVDNPLFFNENTNMVLGDAKDSIDEMNAGLKDILGGD
jgi:NAD/NADP transhydrogenase beta subunit